MHFVVRIISPYSSSATSSSFSSSSLSFQAGYENNPAFLSYNNYSLKEKNALFYAHPFDYY